MKGKNIYAFIPIGVALVVGGIQTAIIGNAFTAEAWYIAALLIGCVWLTAGMDAAAFHYSAINGATRAQKLFLAISAISLVIVLAVDLVWMFAPDAFNTDDAIIRDLSYATGINLAVSTLCLLGWIFFSEEHASDRKANQERLDVILQERLAALRSPEAQSLYQQLARAEIMHEVMQANRDLRSIINTAPKQLFAPEQALPPPTPPRPAAPPPPNNVNQTFHSAAPVIHLNSGQDAPRPQPQQPSGSYVPPETAQAIDRYKFDENARHQADRVHQQIGELRNRAAAQHIDLNDIVYNSARDGEGDAARLAAAQDLLRRLQDAYDQRYKAQIVGHVPKA